MIRKEIVKSPNNSSGHIVRYMPWFTDRICINVIYGDLMFLHDHPWDYATLILWGGYKETVLGDGGETTKIRPPGFLTYRKAESFHRITPIFSRAITLFYRSKTKNKYTSFLVNGKKIRDAKYWLSVGISKDNLKERVIWKPKH